MITSRSQRWRERQNVFRPAAEQFDPAAYGVDVIPERDAKAFVIRHHYSGSYPAARLAVGLFHRPGVGPSHLVGVAVLSVSMNGNVGPKYTRLTPSASVELGRFVLLDEVPGNGESFFLSRVFRLLRAVKPGIEAVVSYADPVERRSADGHVLKPGLVGSAYAATGASYRGRSGRRTLWTTAAGAYVSERALSKIRGGETGHAYAIDQLVALGAPAPSGDPASWLQDLIRTGFLRSHQSPGNHTYAWPLTLAAKLAAKGLPNLPYPEIDRSARGDVTALPLLRLLA